MQFSEHLLQWYATHKRDLPWRNISDPYRIWVSEIILQQTRVVQGYDYYLRFIDTFPTVEDLAAASEDQVMRVWQGLGYYSRARNMHYAAKQIVALEHFPDSYHQVRALKGIGDYTAAAICSFAFNLRCAVVDGNVYRVLSRFFGIDTPIDTTAGKKMFQALAEELLPGQNVADYNQALMDFGALQCVPSSPQCEVCPLADACVAFQQKSVEDYPVKSHRVKMTHRYFVYLRVHTPNGVWLHRRQSRDIWKGLYEFPLLEYDHRPDFSEVLAHPFVKQLGTKGVWTTLHEGMKHVLTHQTIWADAYALHLNEPVRVPEDFFEIDPVSLSDYALPKLLLRIASVD